MEAVTKAAQQEELERRRRLEQQRKQDFPTPALPECKTGEKTVVPLTGDTESLTCSHSKPLNSANKHLSRSLASEWCILSNMCVIQHA